MSIVKAALLSASTLALLAAAPVRAEDAATASADEIVVVGHPQIGTFGVDLTARDTAAKPGDDFERYASGSWIDKTEIPSDRPSTGSFINLREDVQSQVQKLITSAPAGSKFGALYSGFMDEKRVERVGLAPLMADIAAVRAVADKSAFARHMGSTYAAFGFTLFNFGPYADTANPEINVLWMSQGGLGLPEKDYYFNPQFAKQRGAYYAYIERTMRALGKADPKGAAAQVMAFETGIASLSWNSDQSRQIQLINNPYSTQALKAYAPGLDWDAFFAGANLAAQDRMIVNENTAIRAIAKLFDATPLDTLKLWQEFHIADQAAPYLNKAMVDSRFAYTSSLSGVTQNRPRWKRAVDLVNTSLGELVGQAYVAQHFPPLAKTRMESLVANLKWRWPDGSRPTAG